MNNDIYIRVDSMNYNESRNIIENLEMKLQEGSATAILGPSGAGKTTLLRIISGLEKHFSGEIMLGGKRITKPTRDIQLLFQDNRLFPWMTVAENITFAFKRPISSSQILEARKVIHALNIKHKAYAWPKTLSGGEESRIALARVFVDPPRLLLLDEPFRNLDIVLKWRLMKELSELLQNKKITAIMVSHDIEDAVFLSDEVYLFSSHLFEKRALISIDLPRPRKAESYEFYELCRRITKELHYSDYAKSKIICQPNAKSIFQKTKKTY